MIGLACDAKESDVAATERDSAATEDAADVEVEEDEEDDYECYGQDCCGQDAGAEVVACGLIFFYAGHGGGVIRWFAIICWIWYISLFMYCFVIEG